MHPDLYLVAYRQQERELERHLLRRLQQTCCRALGTARRSWSAALSERLSALRPARALSAC